MSRDYKNTRSDFEYLETKTDLYDWAWLEENFLDLLQNPTKRYAATIYESAIIAWFSERGSESPGINGPDKPKNIDDRVHRIAKRYGIEFVESEL